ncbi:MAG: hypothetical protein K0S56_1970 [Microvirga sp.]|nr:hypothetical protein [Microvirga sp.]
MIQEPKPRLSNIHRAIILSFGLSAVAGWCLFAFSSQSSADVERQLRGQVASLQESQKQLVSERAQTRASLTDLAKVRAQLVAARDELARLAESRERNQASRPAGRDVSETGSIRPILTKSQQAAAVSAQKALPQPGNGSLADSVVGQGALTAKEKPLRSKESNATPALDTAGLRRMAGTAE